MGGLPIVMLEEEQKRNQQNERGGLRPLLSIARSVREEFT